MAAPAVFYPGAEIYEHWRIAGNVCTNATAIDCMLIIDVSWAGKNFTSINTFVLTNSTGDIYKFYKENFIQLGQTLYVWGILEVGGGTDKDVWLQAGATINVSNAADFWSEIGIPSGTYANRYSMDETSGNIIGVNGTNLVNGGGTLGVTGLIGKAYRDINTGDLYGANDGTLNCNAADKKTLISAVKWDGISQYNFWQTKNLGSPTYRGMWFYQSYVSGSYVYIGYWMVGIYGTNQLAVSNSLQLKTDMSQWNVMAVVDDGSKNAANMKIYRNGNSLPLTVESNTLAATSILNAANYAIGSVHARTNKSGAGDIDETRVYNTNKSADYIKGWSNLVLSNSTYATRIGYGYAPTGSARRRRYYSGFGPGKF